MSLRGEPNQANPLAETPNTKGYTSLGASRFLWHQSHMEVCMGMDDIGHLSLTRRVGERVIIGDDVAITVVEIGPNGKVRLVISAPKGVAVLRDELLGVNDPRRRITG